MLQAPELLMPLQQWYLHHVLVKDVTPFTYKPGAVHPLISQIG